MPDFEVPGELEAELVEGLSQSLIKAHDDLRSALTMLHEANPRRAMWCAEQVGLGLRTLLAHLLTREPSVHERSPNAPEDDDPDGPPRPPHPAPSLTAVHACTGTYILWPLIKLALWPLLGTRPTLEDRELDDLRVFGRAGEDEAGRNLAYLANRMLIYRRERREARREGTDGG